ncbi:TVG0422635 [Thermoplasma volcanium GSS1]|uniref:TVG0422635 protein n=1 Tax=Thermoplasma volcanium (strain ATCC 51530 / DSM 4299 / JCM 9571 / NBRC 15438 / GSS1) TaxID=273116 RepID=Q97BM2_THEVO|nr:hypothetical protein [Thermoplasma volcanium]BAB59575.1 TVG0422635 [Thermoplasma volcanium GSS1]
MGYEEGEFWHGIALKVLYEGSKTVYKKDPVYGNVPAIERSAVFRRSIGEPKGQIADWRCTFPGDPRSVHAVEYIDRYEIHVDKFDPSKHPLKHVVYDAPSVGLFILPLTIIAALFLARKRF